MFSKACTYAIRAMIFICHSSNQERRVGIKDIAKEISSPEPFTGKILQQLSKKGLVNSIKGPNGGFYVDPKQKEQTLSVLVDAIDGDQLMTGCGLGFDECSEEHPCPIHHRFKSIRTELNEMLNTTTIDDLSKGLTDGSAYLQNIVANDL